MTNAIILDFYADWCVHCPAVKKSVGEISETHSIPARYVNADTEKELVELYGVLSLPTLILVGLNGEEVSRLVGRKSTPQILAWLNLPNS